MREDFELREAPGHGEHDPKQAKQGEHGAAERTAAAAAAAERDFCCQAHFRQEGGLEPNDRFQVRHTLTPSARCLGVGDTVTHFGGAAFGVENVGVSIVIVDSPRWYDGRRCHVEPDD